MNLCKEGHQYWLDQGIEDLETFMLRAHKEGHSDWAIWLFVRSVDRPIILKFSIFCAEMVLPIFERKYPEDNRPRKAIESAKAVLADNTEENKKATDAAAAATATAAYAYAAYAAATATAAANAATDAKQQAYKKMIKEAVKLLEVEG